MDSKTWLLGAYEIKLDEIPQGDGTIQHKLSVRIVDGLLVNTSIDRSKYIPLVTEEFVEFLNVETLAVETD